VSELRVKPIIAALLARGFFEARKREILALIECTLGGDDYARLMIERGTIG
jgi:hypothetical protein